MMLSCILFGLDELAIVVCAATVAFLRGRNKMKTALEDWLHEQASRFQTEEGLDEDALWEALCEAFANADITNAEMETRFYAWVDAFGEEV